MEEELDSATATGGGPIDGEVVFFSGEKGVLVINKEAGKAWVYDLAGDSLVCRNPEGDELDDAGRYKAAEDGNYTILAVGE